MDALTLDQFQVFAAVVEEGSFSAAARRLNRAQSAVTYAIQKLEEQVGADLFDRSAYRPTLSDAGRALLPRAQRVLADVADFRVLARGIAGGLEPELSLVVDSMFPMAPLVRALTGFQEAYPSVQTRIHSESLGAAGQAVLEGRADIGVVLDFASRSGELERTPLTEIELVPVAAPQHPLAQRQAGIEPEELHEHVQLVLTDRSSLTQGHDHGVLAVRTWRLADLGSKHAMLLAGLGWGTMPRHIVKGDLAAGRLVRLKLDEWNNADGAPKLSVVLAHRRDRALGPAGRWMLARLAQPERPAVEADSWDVGL